jgi:hypothetical protein
MGNSDHKRCFISGCNGRSEKENTRVGLFSVPKNSLKIWQDIIPRGGLTTTSKICSRHFEEADIEKGRIIQDKFHPYLRWSLKRGALPKLFLGSHFLLSLQPFLSAICHTQHNILNFLFILF